ncbi:pantoate--beta-alanine ligase, partial [candidate division KSB1 bacterium]|nr:pantoate--beta-alanine ligase [candidate division KSB1 bacterium]
GMIEEGERDASKIKDAMHHIISTVEARIDYISIADMYTLQELSRIRGHLLISLAVFIGKIRLIDNVSMEVI